MAAAEIKEIGDVLAGLSVKDAAGLAAYLKEAYRIEAPASTAIVAPIDGVDKPDVPLPPSAVVDVLLTSAGEKKISVIKVVRQFASLGLKEAKDLVDATPAVVKSGVDRAEAEKIRDALVEQGATVELK
jgi:large subunit ribosomal protein L7/L12